jgi:ribonuclease BN (tRNA processing enzyme)
MAKIVTKFNLLTLGFLSVILASSCSTVVAKDVCQGMQLQVLGSGGPEINDGLASSSYLIWIDGKAVLMIDAGGGSSLIFEKSSANFNHLKAILLTHLHVDHSAELPVYIKAGYFTHRDQNLPIFGPTAGGEFPSTENFVKALFSDQQASVYPYLSDNLRQQQSTDFLLEPVSVNPEDKIWKHTISENLSIAAIKVIHGAIPAIAWRVNYRGCSVSFSGDMNGSSGNLQILAKDSQLLIANNAIPENANPIAQRLHMTPSTIGKIAKQAGVKKLILSHFMNRSKDIKAQSKQIIAEYYPGEIIFAFDLLKHDLQ